MVFACVWMSAMAEACIWAWQGGGGRDDDYVSRSEFRLLLVSCTAVRSMGSFVTAVASVRAK